MDANRQEIKRLIAEVAGSQGNTYDPASDVWTYSLDVCATTDKEWIYPALYALWGALTDWVEVKPEETDEAEATMRDAAQAFLPIVEDDDALRLYFDHWLYEERGGFYARPAPPPKNPPFSQTKEGQRRQDAARARSRYPWPESSSHDA
jgi:hypothetical protein